MFIACDANILLIFNKIELLLVVNQWEGYNGMIITPITITIVIVIYPIIYNNPSFEHNIIIFFFNNDIYFFYT